MDAPAVNRSPAAVPAPRTGPSGRLRICFVTVEFHGLFKNGGIGTANTALALALAGQGFEVTVAIANADAAGPKPSAGSYAQLQAHYAGQGIALEHVPPPVGPDDARTVSYAVYQYLRPRGFDIVMFNDNAGQGFYTLLAKQAGLLTPAPLLCVVAHGPLDWVAELNAQEHFFRGMPVAYMESRCAGLADLLISPSRYLLDWMTARGWVARGQGMVLQNLIGTAAQPDAVPPTAHPVDELVFFGRQETRKGLDLFCDAIDRLDAAGALTDVRVTFLGKFSKSAWVHSGVYIAERARRWRAPLRVLTEYDQAEALAYLRRPGVLAVIPSRAENSPCVVAECLIQGVPFLASSGGGTAELIAEPDRAACLFTPDAEALAARVQSCLAHGQKPGRLAIPQEETLKQWVALLRTAHAEAAAPLTLPSLSVCLAWSAAPSFPAALATLRSQSLAPLEIIIAGPADAAFAAAELPGVRKVAGYSASRAAARNAAAAQATGDYLCFIDESRAVPETEALATLATAAAHTGADILTAMAETGGLPLPVGGCAELGVIEPCFGAGIWAIARSRFAASGGFAARDGVLDWAYLAGAVLAGARLELVPAVLSRLHAAPVAAFAGAGLVEDQRALLAVYAERPLGQMTRLVEAGLHWGEARRQGLAGFKASLPAEASALVQSLSPLEANSAEARRMFAAYCCERRLPELALDYALHNDAALLPNAVKAALQVNAGAARRALSIRELALHHHLGLTAELAPRARAFHGLEQAALTAEEGVLVRYAVPPGIGVVKFAGACPPGTNVLTLTANSAAGADLRLGAVLCRAWARPRLSLEGMEPEEGAWWSGWQTPQPGRNCGLALRLPAPCTELLDLYLVTSQAGDATPRLTWRNVTVELCLTGELTPSALEVVEVSTPIPAAQLARGEVLTDLAGVNFPLYRPGPPTLLHPLADRLAVVRLPALLPAGAAGLQCSVSLGHEQSHPVDFALWARPAGSPAALSADPAQEPLFSGWTGCAAQGAPQPINFRLPRDAAGPWDIYLVTRLVDQPDAYFCHALWHDFAVIERDQPGPVIGAPAIIASPAPEQGLLPRLSYLVCSAPRTGSNLLSSGLRDTGVAGQPREYFLADSHGMNNLPGIQQLEGGPPLSLAARVPLLLQAGSQGGIFGATMHWVEQVRLVASLREAAGTPDRPPLECLRAAFPGLRFIWLRRENLLAQAISHYVARKSDVWYVWEDKAPSTERKPVPFDFEGIQDMLKGAEFEEQGWRRLLAGQEADTLVLTYEELAADYQGALTRVLGFLDVPVPEGGLPTPKLRRQADARNEELEQLYLAEAARRQAAKEDAA